MAICMTILNCILHKSVQGILKEIIKPKIDVVKLLLTRERHFDSVHFVTINGPIFVNLFMIL